VQLAGTLFFNFRTGNAVRADRSAQAAHQHVWRPDAVGSACFLVASALAWFINPDTGQLLNAERSNLGSGT
jgi:hypothetical protein